MNIKSLLLSGVAMILLLLAVFTINVDKTSNKHYAKAKAEKSMKETAEAKGSSDYFHMMRANPLTGKFEQSDLEAVVRQINTLSNDKNKTTALGAMEWVERGPDNIGGRTRGMFSDINNPNKMYMGGVSGGFWTSIDRGNTWLKMAGMDSAMRNSVSCIAQAANGDIYYGTGESFADISGIGQGGGIPGGGIFKSTDGGITSTNLSSTSPPFNANNDAFSYINRIACDPNNANRLFAAVNRGLRVSTDGGASWAFVSNVPTGAPITDVKISSSGNVVLAASTSQMYISTDGGNTFIPNVNSTTNGLPGAGGVNRIEVAIAPSDENTMYCVMSASANNGLRGVYKSSDKGQNWTTIGVGGSFAFNPLGTQGTYNIALGVHPTIPDMVFVGGQLELYRYTPAAAWEPIAYWANSPQFGTFVHADMHGIMFNSGSADEMYVVTDGGFFKTQDCTAPDPFFLEKNKEFATAQCYGVAANRLGHIIFGMQDNGTAIINGSIANSPKAGIDGMGGDGMRGAISDINPDYVFGTSQNGGLRRSTDGGRSQASFRNIFDRNIDGSAANSTQDGRPDEGSPWIAPIELKENFTGSATKSVFLIGFNDNVWFTQNAVGTGTVVWFKLTTKTGANFSSITVNDDGTVAYVGSLGGGLWKIEGIDLFNTRYQYDDTTTNRGLFSGDSLFVETTLSVPGSGAITDIETDGTGNEVIVTTPRYGVSQHVFRSMNGLSASPVFTSIQGNLPAMPVYSAAVLNQPNSYLVGTDLGVWGTDNGGATWTEMNNIFSGPESTWHPRVATMQIAVEPFLEADGGGYAGEIIYTGTYGRGTFSSISRNTGFWPTSTSSVNTKKQSLRVYPNPATTSTNLEYTATKSGDAVIKVRSLTGKVLSSQMAKLSIGDNKINVDLNGLARGVYLVSVNSANGMATTKLIKR